ncbi:proto-oncogene Mas-like [Pseudophryne corroboree]|uniref:proto-oncogene Mas-like n=1 Tax=Pseudophryne corroboree TaxID=495146 RepID=UPI003081C200
MEENNMTMPPSVTETLYWNNHTMLFKPVYNIVISPITMILSIFGMTGNSLVVWYLSFKIKRTTSTIYIFNLAVADNGFLLFVFVLHILSMVFVMIPHLESQYEDEHVINVIGALTLACLFGYNTSLCLLTAISIERCLSVLFPIWYHCNRPRHLSSIVCTLIWIISCTLSALEMSFCYSVIYNSKGLIEESGNECKVVFILICCFSFLIFIPCMIMSSLVLLIKLQTSSHQRQPKKLYIVITVTVLFFLVFGMPMRFLLLVWYKRHIMPPFPLMDIFSLFCSFNSSINPFIYFLVGRQGSRSGKITLLAIFQAVFRDEGNYMKREQKRSVQADETTM